MPPGGATLQLVAGGLCKRGMRGARGPPIPPSCSSRPYPGGGRAWGMTLDQKVRPSECLHCLTHRAALSGTPTP